MNKFLRVLKLALPYYWAWILSIICMIIFTICNTVSVMGMIPLIDKVLSNKPIKLTLSVNLPFNDLINNFLNKLNNFHPLDLLNLICIFLIFITLIKGITQFTQQILMEWVSQNVSKQLRLKLFDKYFYLPFNFFTGSKTGELISRITLDVNLIQVIFSGRFTNTILDSLHFFPFLFIVFLIDWKMTLLCFIVIPVALLPIILIGRQIRKITHKTQQNYADISSNIFEILNGIKIIKIFNKKDKEMEKFSNICSKTVKARIKSQKKEALLSPITEFIGVSTGVFLLWWFAPNVLKGKMSLGVFITYITCIACMIKPIKTFGKIQIMIQNALAGADRLFYLLDKPQAINEVKGDIEEIKFRNSIKFDNVSFSYNKDSNILKNISFEIKKGEVVALVGPSGSGKTTIAHLIPKFFNPNSGSILIDNKDLRDIHATSIRNIIGMVTQEPILFNASIKENIAYPASSINMDDIIRASKLSKAYDFIQDFKEGFNTLVGERGVRLSGGEKQRISIARALIKNPNIIIFDEATSALDTTNEMLVQEAIDKVMEERTVLIIAHRLSTVVKAHKIIVIDDGMIIEQGSHAELINNNGLYKKLYEMNFKV